MNDQQIRKAYCREQAVETTKQLIKAGVVGPGTEAVFVDLLAVKFEIVYVQGEKFAVQRTLDKLKGKLNHG